MLLKTFFVLRKAKNKLECLSPSLYHNSVFKGWLTPCHKYKKDMEEYEVSDKHTSLQEWNIIVGIRVFLFIRLGVNIFKLFFFLSNAAVKIS